MSNLVSKLTPCLLFLVATNSAAEELQADGFDFSWGGFITQGWTYTSENNFYGKSADDSGSFDFRELGLYGSVNLLPQLRLSGQLLSRLAGEAEDGEVAVDHLILDWSLQQEADLQSGLRVGRIKHLLGFYNDTRDIAFTRSGAVLPQSIYQDRIRDISISSDGVAAYLRKSTDMGYFNFDLQLGRPQAGTSTELALLGRDWEGEFDDSRLWLFRALYETPTNGFRVAFTYVDATMPFDAASTDPFNNSEVDFSVIGLSAQWNFEHWSLTSELMYEKPDRTGFGGLYNPSSTKAETFYMQLDHRLSSQWSAFLRYDMVYADVKDKSGEQFENSGSGRKAHQRYAKDWTLGVGYQPNQNWLFRAEWHHIKGTAWLPILDNPVSADTEENWDLAILQASYRF